MPGWHPLRGARQTGSAPARTRADSSGSATGSPPAKSRLWRAGGSAVSLTRSPHRIAGPATPTNISMLQTEFSLTQVLDRPVTGRLFFEQVIRENLDLGASEPGPADLRSPDHAQNAGALSNPGDHRGRHPLAPHRLQGHAHQAVPQGGAHASRREHEVAARAIEPGVVRPMLSASGGIERDHPVEGRREVEHTVDEDQASSPRQASWLIRWTRRRRRLAWKPTFRRAERFFSRLPTLKS